MSNPHQLDTRGLLCPIPVIRAQEVVSRLPKGTRVEIIATDPGIIYDIPAWCRIHGHQVLHTATQDDEYHIEFQIC